MRRAFRLDAASVGTCCPLCAPCAPTAALGQQLHSQRILRTIAAHATPAADDTLSWPHRPELKVTASEKLTAAPEPSFPTTFPLDFIEQHTGLRVRSVAATDFASAWRDAFRSTLSAKDAAAQHDEFWATGASNGRALQWRLLEIPPHSAYPLHIHPGVEVYLVVRGVLVRIPASSAACAVPIKTLPLTQSYALRSITHASGLTWFISIQHEWRMVGPPLLEPRHFDDEPELVESTLDFAAQGGDFAREIEHVRSFYRPP